MKFTVKQITEGEDEVILKYQSMTPKVRRIYEFLCGEQTKLVGQKGKTQVLLERQHILYTRVWTEKPLPTQRGMCFSLSLR